MFSVMSAVALLWLHWMTHTSPPTVAGFEESMARSSAEFLERATWWPLAIIRCTSIFNYIGCYVLLLVGWVSFLWQTACARGGNYFLKFVFLGACCLLPLYIPVRPWWNDTTESLSALEMIHGGLWYRVYQHPVDPSKVVKILPQPGFSHNNFCHVKIPLAPYCNCGDRCHTMFLLVHRLATWLQTNHNARAFFHFREEGHLARVLQIDVDNQIFVVEKAESRITTKCEPDLLGQLLSFNRALERKHFYLDDCHACNWMWMGSRVVSIDGELYSPLEYKIQKFVVSSLDSRNRGFMPLPGCSRCFHWLDGSRITMKQILEGRIFKTPEAAPLEWRADWRNKTFACDEVFQASGGREALTPEMQELMLWYDEAWVATVRHRVRIDRQKRERWAKGWEASGNCI